MPRGSPPAAGQVPHIGRTARSFLPFFAMAAQGDGAGNLINRHVNERLSVYTLKPVLVKTYPLLSDERGHAAVFFAPEAPSDWRQRQIHGRAQMALASSRPTMTDADCMS